MIIRVKKTVPIKAPDGTVVGQSNPNEVIWRRWAHDKGLPVKDHDGFFEIEA